MLPSGWIYDDEQEEINDIIKKVNELPIADVLAAYGTKPERHSGIYVKALCPFHLDNTVGSFMINTERNSCYCYSCAQGGGVAKSMSLILEKSISDAALQVACDRGIIDKNEFKRLSGVKYKPVAKEFKSYQVEKEDPIETLSTRALKDSLYRFTAEYFGLSDDHRNYLLGERKLMEADLCNYFSINTEDKDVKRQFLNAVKSKYSEKIDVIATKVPGFFYTNEKLDVIPKKGVGMLLKSARDVVTAVQVRADEKKEDMPRYTFLSYKAPKSFEKYGVTGGSSSGITFDIIFSKKPGKKLAVVEGKFKAEILAQNGFNVISVQGVNNFTNIEVQIREIERVLGITFPKVTIFYDADFIKNPQVTAATIKLSEYFKKKGCEFDIDVAYWDPNLGKGIDDLIIAGNRRHVKLISCDKYSAISQKSFTEALFTTGFDSVPQSKIGKDDRTLILNEFESIMRRKFSLN